MTFFCLIREAKNSCILFDPSISIGCFDWLIVQQTSWLSKGSLCGGVLSCCVMLYVLVCPSIMLGNWTLVHAHTHIYTLFKKNILTFLFLCI